MQNRAAMACDTFQYTNTGFTATISTEKDVPVFSASRMNRAGPPMSTAKRPTSKG